MGGSHQVLPAAKQIVDLTMSRKKPMGLPGRLEASHLTLSLSSGLLGDLRPIIQVSVLPMGDTRQQFPACSSIAAQPIGDKEPGNIVKALQQLTKEALGSALVPALLDKDV